MAKGFLDPWVVPLPPPHPPPPHLYEIASYFLERYNLYSLEDELVVVFEKVGKIYGAVFQA